MKESGLFYYLNFLFVLAISKKEKILSFLQLCILLSCVTCDTCRESIKGTLN